MEDADAVEQEAAGPFVEGVDYKLGSLQLGLNYDFQNLTLTLRIIKAKDLPPKDVTGTSDPYVKIMLLPDKKHKLLTKVKKKNLNPHWNECFLFEGEYTTRDACVLNMSSLVKNLSKVLRPCVAHVLQYSASPQLELREFLLLFFFKDLGI